MKKLFFSYLITLPMTSCPMEANHQRPQTPVVNRPVVVPNAPAREQALHREGIRVVNMVQNAITLQGNDPRPTYRLSCRKFTNEQIATAICALRTSGRGTATHDEIDRYLYNINNQ